MRIIISPTKKMRQDDQINVDLTTPVFLEKTNQLLQYIKTLSYDQLQILFQSNEKITRENYERYHHMDLSRHLSPAILSYDGIAFQYMSPQIFTDDYFAYVNQHLRILSGFYGVLKPFDGIVAYRLEMQSKLNAPFAKSLYHFWKDDIYREVMDDSHVIVNLASQEYSKVVKSYLNKKDTWIDVIFGEYKGSKVVEKGVYVKMARGEMVRYMAEHQIKDIQEIKKFNRLNYKFDEKLSTSTKYVFIRESDKNEKSNEF